MRIAFVDLYDLLQGLYDVWKGWLSDKENITEQITRSRAHNLSRLIGETLNYSLSIR